MLEFLTCMVTKAQKEETINKLKEKFSRAKSIFSTIQTGLSVAEISKLRRQVRPLGAEFKIAKNTLFRKAAQGTAFEALTSELQGPSAFLFCYDDPISPASSVKSFSKETKDKIEFGSAYLDGQILDKNSALKVASLPSKDVILAQIAGMLVQNTQSIAYILSELGQKPEQNTQLKDLITSSNNSVETASASEDIKEETK